MIGGSIDYYLIHNYLPKIEKELAGLPTTIIGTLTGGAFGVIINVVLQDNGVGIISGCVGGLTSSLLGGLVGIMTSVPSRQ